MDDHEEYLSLLLRHQNDLRAFLGSIVRDRHLCDDIFQEVALVLWKKFDQYDRTRSFGAWARGIAVHKVMQSFDRNRRKGLVLLAPEAMEAVAAVYEDTPADRLEEEAALRACVQQLPERSRELVRLRYERGLKLREIAEQLSSTLDAVHKALSRIRTALGECVSAKLHGENA